MGLLFCNFIGRGRNWSFQVINHNNLNEELIQYCKENDIDFVGFIKFVRSGLGDYGKNGQVYHHKYGSCIRISWTVGEKKKLGIQASSMLKAFITI